MTGEPVAGGGPGSAAPVTRPDRAAVLRALRDPALPGIRTGARSALVELWYHPWPSLAANVAWSVAVLLTLGIATIWPLGGLLLMPLVALPFAGVMGVGTRIVRGEPVEVRDAFTPWRTHGRRVAVLGAAATAAVLVLAADVIIGLAAVGGPVGWALATGAAWGMAALAAVLLCAWPLLLDPAAPGRGVGEALRLGIRVAFLFPGRTVALTLAAAIALVVATALFAILATFGMAWIALLASTVVLPAADRLTALEEPPA